MVLISASPKLIRPINNLAIASPSPNFSPDGTSRSDMGFIVGCQTNSSKIVILKKDDGFSLLL